MARRSGNGQQQAPPTGVTLDRSEPGNRATDHAGLFIGNGDVATYMRGHDWSSSGLGSPETWPQSLRSMVRILLTSRYQMWMGWGPDLAFFYNDAYRPTLGVKHQIG